MVQSPGTPQYNHQTSLFGNDNGSGNDNNNNGGLPSTQPAQAATTPSSSNAAAGSVPTPASATSSSNNTFVMPNSPVKTRTMTEGYRPKVTRTLGQRPSPLVNASVTYCGNNQIYAFGGFDQFTDEVYNHVLRLDLVSHQWSLVDNYGDIPGVRMGHTATLYQGDRLLVFGGENEHRTYLSDLIIFDLKTAHWTQPAVSGPIPTGRARHAAVLHEDRLFVIGGITGQNNYVLDDICYLDLKTFTWSKSWSYVARFDHSAWIWNDRIWVFGGLSADMDKNGELWWLDLKGVPAFESPPLAGVVSRHAANHRLHPTSPRPPYLGSVAPVVGASGYAANSRTAQVNTPSIRIKSFASPVPGSVAALKFVGGPCVPSQGTGYHFHSFSSGILLDFVTPTTTTTSRDCSLSSLDLSTFRWQKLAEGHEIFKTGYRWHYCTVNEDGTKAWLLGCPTDAAGAMDMGPNGSEECLSDIMEVDLRKYGFLGNNQTAEARRQPNPPSHRRPVDEPSKGLGADLVKLFNQPPEAGSGTDFVVTALADDHQDDSKSDSLTDSGGSSLGDRDRDRDRDPDHANEHSWLAPDAPTSAPIHVHRFILQARWPHFARLYNAQMREFHTKKMHIPEPYSVVKAFLLYLYTDSIHGVAGADDGSGSGSGSGSGNGNAAPVDVSDVAGLLVMSNMYTIPHLRLLCVNRLAKELNVDHACTIWYYAGLANEDWLRKRAANFCLTHWGRIVRTPGFLGLPRSALVELSQEIDTEGRVVGGDELELVGDFEARWYGSTGTPTRKGSMSSQMTHLIDSDVEEDDGMDMG